MKFYAGCTNRRNYSKRINECTPRNNNNRLFSGENKKKNNGATHKHVITWLRHLDERVVQIRFEFLSIPFYARDRIDNPHSYSLGTNLHIWNNGTERHTRSVGCVFLSTRKRQLVTCFLAISELISRKRVSGEISSV